ncbi:MAG: hypothetical protein FJ144_06945 [Deltaproteobacteria bacterium]|nr:hypothetical protein [Deltaproteobacteria bacterium]
MAALALVLGAAPTARAQGIQLTPDSARYLINRFVPPNQQWAITYNVGDDTFTGNVFKTDGGPPSFIWCLITDIRYAPDPVDNNYVFDCLGAPACNMAPCTESQWTPIGTGLIIGGDFVLPPDTKSTLGGNVQPVFTARCALPACHDNVTASGMLTLTAGTTWLDTFNVPAFEAPGSIRVVPFDPESSYLLGKILGTAAGNRMPLGGLPLSEEETAAVRTWIAEGAVDN